MASRIEMWETARLIPYDRNPRTHTDEQVREIMGSIVEFGFTAPILVDGDEGILAGHGRLKAAMMLGLAEVPVIPLDHLTPAQRRAYIIADNRLAENAGWDMDLLRGEIAALEAEEFDTSLLGFTDAELGEIAEALEQPEEGYTDQDDAPDVPPEAARVVSRPGDVWLLGERSRLVVGDMRDPAVRAAALNGRLAQLIVTDPPYNVDYTGATEDQLKIAGDAKGAHEFAEFLAQMSGSFVTMMDPAASLYMFYPSWYHMEFEGALEEAGFEVRAQLVWVKNHFRLNWGRYKFSHEPILYAHLKGQSDAWYGDAAQQTVWMEKRPMASRQHPTMKPVELVERAIVNSSRRGELVADPFAGSGSTLIACERMRRDCALIELDPYYADVILNRWMQWTKRQPVLEETGQSFSTVERMRYVPAPLAVPA